MSIIFARTRKSQKPASLCNRGDGDLMEATDRLSFVVEDLKHGVEFGDL